MFDVHHTLAIAAPTGRVWRVLYDLNRYRDWHPFISLTGKTELGSVLTLQQKKGLGSLPPLSSDASWSNSSRMPRSVGNWASRG